ncbi:MAG: hypothetical protein K2P35_03505 [Lachnospiraceae bacterium]|nr:hypothetical protein [Lachnospiraceae bacterium]
MNDISKECAFFQSAKNIQKNGAYYTDLDHARRIGYLFDFDSAEEISVLEASAGDGEALLAVTGKLEKGRRHMKLFLVELNEETFKEKIEGREVFDYVLNADFLDGVKISNSKFTFAFANWPYGTSKDGKSRMETKFLEKEGNYLATGAYIAMVVPKAALEDGEFRRKLLAYYEVCGLWRFDNEVYKEFRQFVVVGRKKPVSGYRKELLEAFEEKLRDFENIPFLPVSDEEPEEKFVVKKSFESDIVYFTKKVFNPGDFMQHIHKSVLFTSARVTNDIFIPHYSADRELRPLLPLTKDMSYICAVQGQGEGLCGSAEHKDLHLQRGSVKVGRKMSLEGEEGRKYVCEKIRSRVRQTVIENNGRVTQFG